MKLNPYLNLYNSTLCVKRENLNTGESFENFQKEMKEIGVRTVTPRGPRADQDAYYFHLKEKPAWSYDFEQNLEFILQKYVARLEIRIIDIHFE